MRIEWSKLPRSMHSAPKEEGKAVRISPKTHVVLSVLIPVSGFLAAAYLAISSMADVLFSVRKLAGGDIPGNVEKLILAVMFIICATLGAYLPSWIYTALIKRGVLTAKAPTAENGSE